MATKKTISELPDIIKSFKNNNSMVNKLALYSNNDDGLAIIFVEEEIFSDLLDSKNCIERTEKYFDWKQFLHPDDYDLVSYALLSQNNQEQIIFNLRVIKENKSIAIFNVELEKVDLDMDNKIIVLNAKVYDVKNLLNENKIDKVSKINCSSMLKHTNDFIFFKDLHHIYTASSQTMANITGYSSGEEHVGLTDYDIFPKEHADKYYILEKEIYLGNKSLIAEVQPFYDESGKEGWVDNRKYPLKDENGKIVGLFGIARIVTEEILTRQKLEETQKQLKILANNDSLTSLFNRRYGYDLCQQIILQTNRYNTPLSLIMLDIDFFKKINDTYGHDCGDKVLICISDTISKTIRESDIAFRYGGEEFVICSPHSKLSDTISLMERINSKISLSFPSCIDKAVTVSSGIVELIKDESFTDLVKRADKLLYEAKVAGRNCIKY